MTDHSMPHKKHYKVLDIRPVTLGFADGNDPKYLQAVEDALNASGMVIDGEIKFYDHVIMCCC